MLLSSQLRYALYGTVLSASLISLSSGAFAAAADGVFGDYFRNIINTPCTYGYEVITGFSTSTTNDPTTGLPVYGTRQCTSISTVLGNIPTAVNVGIGTATPNSKLDVRGGIRSQGGAPALGDASNVGYAFDTDGDTGLFSTPSANPSISNGLNAYINGASAISILSNGGNPRIGIGTATPSAKLDVTGNVFVNGKGGMSYYNQAGYDQIEFGTPTGSSVDVSFHTSGVSKMWIKPSGNVGIGTATPGARLEVNGQIKSTNGLDVGNAGGTYTNISLRDDQSPNGVKYIHANDNNIGFLNGAGNWIARWDEAGNQVNAGDIKSNTKISTPELCLNGICKTVWPTSGAGAGGIVTGPLTWSAEYGPMVHEQAWSTCLSLAPAGQWRIPSPSDIELGRRVNGGLFTGINWYWSSSPHNNGYSDYFWAWSPAIVDWGGCYAGYTTCNNNYGYQMALRCVSNS